MQRQQPRAVIRLNNLHRPVTGPIKLFWSVLPVQGPLSRRFSQSASASEDQNEAEPGEEKGERRTGVVLAIYTTAPIERRTLKTLDVKRKGSWLLRTYCKGSPGPGRRGWPPLAVGWRYQDILDIASI